MKFSEMLEVLDNCPIEIFCKENFSVDIGGIKMIEKNQSTLLPNILYFGHVDNLPKIIQMDYTVNILCYGDIRNTNTYYDNSRLNLLVLGDTVDAFTIYNQLQEVFWKVSKSLQECGYF